MRRPHLPMVALLVLSACGDDVPGGAPTPQPKSDATAPDSGPPPNPLDALPIAEELKGPGLGAPVDVVRDDAGIPHIYAATIPDAAYAQGFMMAQDRWLEMDFGRRQASGTLSEIVGDFSAAAFGSDIRYRAHHLRGTAEAGWNKLVASSDPTDKLLVATLKSFSAGVNAWQEATRAGKYTLPKGGLEAYYGVSSIAKWSELDSLVLGELQAFQLAFDANTDVARTAWDNAEAANLVGNADPQKALRVGFSDDYWRFAPFDPTFTVDGWKEVAGAPTAMRKPPKGTSTKGALALLRRDLPSLTGIGLDRKNDQIGRAHV